MNNNRSVSSHITKPAKSPATSKKPKSNDNDGLSGFFRLATSSVKEIGIPGFLTVFFCYIFWNNGSDEQKSEFIDTFFLFKNVEDNKFPFGVVIVLLIVIMIFQHYFYTKDIKLVNKELDRVTEEKKYLQEDLNKKRLNSSK